MDNIKCQYEPVATVGDITTDKTWKPLLRQLLICSGVWSCYFQSGLCFGAPTVFIPQLRREVNVTINDDLASWLSSAYSLGSLPWIIFLPLLAQFLGRRRCFFLVCTNTLIGFIVFFFSSSTLQLLLSQTIQGLVNASTVTLSLMIVTEYTSPRNRGIFLTLKTATFVWGLWVSNAIGTFFHWRKIGFVGIVCSVYSLISVLFWPESPYWLAQKGRLVECAEAHRWLKGTDEEANKELNSITGDTVKRPPVSSRRLQRLRKLILTREFSKPILLCTLILAQYNFSGKLICSVYSIEIIKTITNNESTAYTGMLILDGLTVLGTYLGCILSKYLKRRTLLMFTSTLSIVFLFLISSYLFLVNSSFFTECKYVSISLLIAFSVSVSCGPMILATSLCGELLPLKYRTFSSILIGSIGNIILGVLVKISPYIFKSLGLHGTFLFYAVLTTMCTVLIYKYVPETKDRTLQEIADFMSEKRMK